MKETILDCQHISKTYQDGNKQTAVLSDVSFQVSTGEQVAIVGSSGSGKSTLLHILGSLDKPSAGQVVIGGKNITQMSDEEATLFRRHSLGFIYQFHHLLMDFSVLENVCMPLLIQGKPIAKVKQQATSLLAHVGLQDRLTHLPSELSGGERQRVAIARALVTNPSLVLADEPTGNLDKANTQMFYQLLRELNREIGTSFVVVTHDLSLAEQLDRVLHLQLGQLQPEETV